MPIKDKYQWLIDRAIKNYDTRNSQPNLLTESQEKIESLPYAISKKQFRSNKLISYPKVQANYEWDDAFNKRKEEVDK